MQLLSLVREVEPLNLVGLEAVAPLQGEPWGARPVPPDGLPVEQHPCVWSYTLR